MEKYHGNTVEHWKQYAEVNYPTTPISVLRYITVLEEQVEQLRQHFDSGSLPSLNKIQLEPVHGSTYCQYSIIEQKLATLYQNQEKILQAIKLLGNDR